MKGKLSVLVLFAALALAPGFCTAGSAEPQTKTFILTDPMVKAGEEPIVIAGEARRPLIFFRKLANQRWKIGGLFTYLFMASALLRIFLPRLTKATARSGQANYFSSLSAAFIYATALGTIVRFSFANDALNAMGVFTFGLLQLSFALGSCIGVNLFAQNLYDFLTNEKTTTSTTARVITYGFCLLVVGIVITVISMVPNLGPLPRLGNRMVMLVAALGLGGLVNLAAGNQKSDSEAQI